MNINITNDDIGYPLYRPGDFFLLRGVGAVGDFCLRSKLFSLLTLGHLHTLVHETGHAVAHIALTGGSATINISTKSCYGSTSCHGGPPSSSIGRTWVHLSGPLADMIFSVALIVGVFALTCYVPMHPMLALGLQCGISAGSIIWISGEFFYAFLSGCNKDHGDFGRIAQEGPLHLLFSIALLVAVCAAGAFAVFLLI